MNIIDISSFFTWFFTTLIYYENPWPFVSEKMVKLVTVLETQVCSKCKGSGKTLASKRCGTCNGTGHVEVEILR